MLPPDHPQRLILANEVHARPSEPLETPSLASYVAVLVAPEDRDRELAHLAALCQRHAVAPPEPGAKHFSALLGALRLKWERHGEFSGFTLIVPGKSEPPFSDTATAQLPPDWLAAIPGNTIVAAHAQLVRAGDGPPDAAALAACFGRGGIVVGAETGDGAGWAYTDFQIRADGFARFLVCDRSYTPRQAGRTLQRLFEIEVYRVLALLALPVAREQSPQTLQIEAALAALTAEIAADGGDDEALLHELTRLAAEVENALMASQFRFNACQAYYELVLTRIGELRERRLPGIQTIEEFMTRRLAPAVATCATVSQRLHDLSERVGQARALLSTRVDVARERQNQSLLASMNRRAKQQLRLQQTVEGLSVAAIVYYAAGLIGYVAKAGKASGLPIHPDLVVGLAIPVLLVLVLLALRRAQRKLHDVTTDD